VCEGGGGKPLGGFLGVETRKGTTGSNTGRMGKKRWRGCGVGLSSGREKNAGGGGFGGKRTKSPGGS